MNDTPIWAVFLIAMVVGSLAAFLGMAGNALQEWARRSKRERDGENSKS